MIGQKVDKYEILEEIGQGGMAVVYRARDTKLMRDVAIKILHPHLMRQPEAVERFQREAVTVARLQHPNIIEIFDYSGENSAYRYIVTELVDGLTLAAFLDTYGRIPCELAACIARELALALESAHHEAVVHRDLKPENVMIRRDGKIKLMDFGIARVLEGTNLTMTGSILGSPAFMSPEQVAGRHVDFRSDLFSLGSILYTMVTGEQPFQGSNHHLVLRQVAEADPLPPQELNPAISNEFARLLAQLLDKDPERRYGSAKALLTDLDRLIAEAGIERPVEEVHKLFADPDHYPEQFKKRIVEHLENRAAILSRENPFKAIPLYERLLALRPDHVEASRQMERLVRRAKRQKRLASVLLLVAGIVILASLAKAFLPFGQQEAPSPEPEFPPSAQDAVPDTTMEMPSPIPNIETVTPPSVDPAKLERKIHPIPMDQSPVTRKRPLVRTAPDRTAKLADPKPAPAPEQEKNFTGYLRVFTSPWADIHVNGVKVGTYPMDAGKTFTLAAGKNVVKLVNPGCEPYQEDIRIERAGQLVEVRQRLKILPAFVFVENSQGAALFINGEWKGRTPLNAPIEVRWEQQVSSKTVLVSLTKEGLEPFNTRLRLEAGQTERLKVQLKEKAR